MRNLVTSVAFLALSAGGVLAADLHNNIKAPPPAPYLAPTPVFSWTGVYVGGSLGYAQSQYKDEGGKSSVGSAVLGANIGYNWQLPSNIVLGIESDLSYNFGSRKLVYDYESGAHSEFRLKPSFLGTTRVRLGYAIDRLLLFTTAGLAYGNPSVKGDYHHRDTYACTMSNVNGTCTYTDDRNINVSKMRVGYVVGGGAEYALTPNWSLKLEGMYYSLGSKKGTIDRVETLSFNNQSVGAHTSQIDYKVKNAGFLIRTGVNYKF